MQLSEDANSSLYRIQHYSAAGITVNGQCYTGHLLLNTTGVIGDWQPPKIAELSQADLQPLFNTTIDVILLGTGASTLQPPGRLIADLAGLGIGIEAMDSAAACRTFNILLLEGRQVAAALLQLK